MELTKQQNEAKDLIVAWWNSLAKVHNLKNAKQTFVLLGAAGTGKSFLITHTLSQCLGLNVDDPKDVMFITPTAKSSTVLLKNGVQNSSTIHHFLYHSIEKNKTVVVGGKPLVIRNSKFVRKMFKKEDLPRLIVLDECSMCGADMFNDILELNRPILCTGDIAQLPAVAQKECMVFKHPDYRLTEIVRQKNAETNSIVMIANSFRNDDRVDAGHYEDNDSSVDIYNRYDLKDEQYQQMIYDVSSRGGMIICCRNETRNMVNKMIRKAKGFDGLIPQDGEPVISDQNDYSIEMDGKYILANGMTGTVKNFKVVNEKESLSSLTFSPDFITGLDVDNIIVDDRPLISYSPFLYEQRSNVYHLLDGTYEIKRDIPKRIPGQPAQDYRNKCAIELINRRRAVETILLDRFEFAYCITVWKSQGSTYDEVLYLDEANAFSWDLRPKLRYVAATRPRKKLTIIKL